AAYGFPISAAARSAPSSKAIFEITSKPQRAGAGTPRSCFIAWPIAGGAGTQRSGRRAGVIRKFFGTLTALTGGKRRNCRCRTRNRHRDRDENRLWVRLGIS